MGKKKRRNRVEVAVDRYRKVEDDLRKVGIDPDQKVQELLDHDQQRNSLDNEIKVVQENLKKLKTLKEGRTKRITGILEEAERGLLTLDPGYVRSQKFLDELKAEAAERHGKMVFLRDDMRLWCACNDPFSYWKQRLSETVIDHRGWYVVDCDYAQCGCGINLKEGTLKSLKDRAVTVMGSRILYAPLPEKRYKPWYYKSHLISGPWKDGRVPLGALQVRGTPAAKKLSKYIYKVLIPGRKTPVLVLPNALRDPERALKDRIRSYKSGITTVDNRILKAEEEMRKAKEAKANIPGRKAKVEEFAKKFRLELPDDWDSV